MWSIGTCYGCGMPVKVEGNDEICWILIINGTLVIGNLKLLEYGLKMAD